MRSWQSIWLTVTLAICMTTSVYGTSDPVGNDFSPAVAGLADENKKVIDVWSHHGKAFKAFDVAATASDYSDTAVITHVNEANGTVGTFYGKEGAKTYFSWLFPTLSGPDGNMTKDFEFTFLTNGEKGTPGPRMTGNTIFHCWRANTTTTHYKWATGMFVMDATSGLIMVQNVFAHATPRRSVEQAEEDSVQVVDDSTEEVDEIIPEASAVPEASSSSQHLVGSKLHELIRREEKTTPAASASSQDTPIAATDDIVTMGFTGDVVLHQELPSDQPLRPWGNLAPALKALDLLMINHEATLTPEPSEHPNAFKFRDPSHYSATYDAAGVSFISFANNHQFDFQRHGVQATLHAREALRTQYGIQSGGVGTPEAVRRPAIVATSLGDRQVRVAVFTIVAQLCHKDAAGEDIIEPHHPGKNSCTCKMWGALPGMPAAQCYAANTTTPGLWYLDHPVSSQDIATAADTVRSYCAEEDKADFVVTFVHAGPVFEWQPQPDREQLLRSLSEAGSDIVWGTGSHHIQRMERHLGKPIIYGLGNLIFPYVAAIDNPKECEAGQAPCQQFRPDVSLFYEFHIQFKEGQAPSIQGIQAHPTYLHHEEVGWSAQHALPEMRTWVFNTFNELSNPHGMAMVEHDGVYWVEATNHTVAGISTISGQ